MSSNNSPDLASVLRTLASLAPQNQQQSHASPPVPQPHHPVGQQIRPHNVAANTHVTPPGVTKIIDPASIIDWSAGLRCVMKTVAKHENVLQDIRRMIKVQHEHEEQWWKGREALKKSQEARKDGQKKLDEVLRLVGGAVSTGSSNTSPEEMAKELETFDMKVYKAQVQMVKEMTTRLKGLGVPFFGTKTELVRVGGKGQGEAVAGSGNSKEGDRMIDEADLVKLQRRMLEMLEDLCSD